MNHLFLSISPNPSFLEILKRNPVFFSRTDMNYFYLNPNYLCPFSEINNCLILTKMDQPSFAWAIQVPLVPVSLFNSFVKGSR